MTEIRFRPYLSFNEQMRNTKLKKRTQFWYKNINLLMILASLGRFNTYEIYNCLKDIL